MTTEYNIITDTREQQPLWNKNTIRKTLKTGDYSIEGYEEEISIERKTLPDLFGTLGKGHARFKKELTRARELQYFAIVIEGNITQCLNKEFDGSHHTKMHGHVIMKILLTIHLKYGVPFFFTNGRVESKRLIKELFNSYITNRKYILENNNL